MAFLKKNSQKAQKCNSVKYQNINKNVSGLRSKKNVKTRCKIILRFPEWPKKSTRPKTNIGRNLGVDPEQSNWQWSNLHWSLWSTKNRVLWLHRLWKIFEIHRRLFGFWSVAALWKHTYDDFGDFFTDNNVQVSEENWFYSNVLGLILEFCEKLVDDFAETFHFLFFPIDLDLQFEIQ